MPQLEHQLPISHELIKMKSIILVALALVAVAAASPVDNPPAAIVRSEFNQDPQGSYNFGFESDDGISRSETGELKEALDEENKPHTVVVVRGSYSYTDKEGKPETISYYADETGYHAEGPSVPKPVEN
ncbi:larval cuticle protein 1-like [Trichoplusia ni]|uniref:Larval cuticle protein 1-like n=1 Tax=Trichoplusia ni TaxID=7111 RepID=A0A7E5VLS2_TRINI|nr:larval cuticle protein 1-like [Trichoplusia ni]